MKIILKFPLQKFQSLKILKILEETADAVSVTFDIPENLKNNYSFKSGQYVSLRAKIKGDFVIRSYSICSSPQSGLLTVAIKAIKKGLFSNYANEALRVGDFLEVSSPEGRFVFDNDNSKKTFFGIATGSGITPISSILKDTLISNANSEFVLLYGNKSIADTMFHSEIEKLKIDYKNRFFCYNIYSRESNSNSKQGRINSDFVDLCLKKHPDFNFEKFFICGPEEMILSLSKELEKLGFQKNKILFELFFSKVETESEINLGSSETTAKITCDFEDFEITIPEKMTLLDAALNQKIDVPYSCQGGVCSSCIGKITNGSATMIQNNILTDAEVKEGLILACQAIPTSQSISIDFDDV